MSSANLRREWACWLTLAFRLERLQRRSINGLVLTADRNLKLGLTALAETEPEALPEPLRRYAEVHRQLFEADGKVSAQAFVVERLLEERILVVPITSASYPAHLARTLSVAKAPTVLTVVGNPELLKEQGVSVSGSRAAGPQGLAFARAVGRALARAGITVVSGLARGCDREALEGALEAGGKAIGVAPEGILQTKERKRPEVGAGRLAVVSEFAPSDKWTVARAMARNQTIAGLGRALVVADCVATGGTTDQVEVARGLGLTVFLRRGVGEGAMVAQLATVPGVVPVQWNGGAISLPGLLPGQQAVESVHCHIRHQQGKLFVHIEGPEQMRLEQVLEAIKDSWPSVAGQSDPPGGVPMVAESSPTYEVAEPEIRFPAPPSSLREQLQHILQEAGAEGYTLEQIQEKSGGTKREVSACLKEMRAQGLLTESRKPPPKRYRLKPAKPRVEQDSQLGFPLMPQQPD